MAESLFNNKLGNYLKKLNDQYNSKDKSLTEILKSFSQISSEYNELNEVKNQIGTQYSSNNYSECTPDEQEEFFSDQLQFIETLVVNSIYEKSGILWNWGDIYNLMKDPTYKGVEKIKRKVVYSSSSNQRPIGDMSYNIWNGLQIIDIDIKNEELARNIKQFLFEDLKQYHWFLGCCISASGKSCHVWTKITPISIDLNSRRIEYICNFRHKYSYVYIVLMKHSKTYGYTKEDILTYMDMAMCKPQQGIFIAADDKALLNTNFKDLRLDVNFESAFQSGVTSIDWISHPDLKDIFHKLEWFNLTNTTEDVEVTNISGINDRDISKSKGKKHYKHAQRWQLANTLTSIYGEEKALQIMIEICDGTSRRELAGDVRTAAIHDKPISIWAVKELNKNHGFKLTVKSDNSVTESQVAEAELQKANIAGIDPTKILNETSTSIILNMKYNQYLSDLKDEIIANLSHITLLEAGAGYGKTEMIKSLKAKTLLILPFTSTIKAKVEADEKTSDWLYFYGNKRPNLDDILGDRNMSMTIDKFSRLNVFELDQAGFEYIVIDESHLLFTSSYRDVMSPAIQRLANCKAKIIMMTGTPTGEMLFFPNIKHIKVIKEDYRTKEFKVYFVNTNDDKFIHICQVMAEDIIEGKKILFPTNKGNLFFETVTGYIQQILLEKKYTREIKSFYYKKSNYGEETMDSINIDKSIGVNDIIFCTNYLSVGVDICDRYKFSVYFDETWIAQDIEQFANRLRNNDLYIKLFLETKDSSGMPIKYKQVNPLDLSFSEADLLFARDMIQTCNDMLERNNEESKYNPLIQSLLSSNRYLKYDENDCRYYIDETTYKLKIFEERYTEYSKQLEVLKNGMMYYGYTYIPDNTWENDEISDKEKLEEFKKQCRQFRYNYNTAETFDFLNHLDDGNIDVYKELLKGSYSIFKDDDYKIEREENNLYAKDIEILEKNIPIVIGLYKFYDCDTIRDIFEYCRDKKQNRINYTKLNRIRRFIQIESNRKRKRLDFPILKFVKQSQDWARAHSSTNEMEINKYLADYAVGYANSIKDVVVEDKEYLETIFELTKELWKIIILQSRPKEGKIGIVPFDLLWEKKTDLTDLYGGSELTKTFFIDELVDNMKEEFNEDDEEINKPFELTEKKRIADITTELPNVIHRPYGYYEYSEMDDSNARFMKKQENTNTFRDDIFTQVNTEENNKKKKEGDDMKDLFESTEE